MKLCGKCGIEKDESEFHKDKQKKDGLSNYCKSCVRDKGKVYRANNRTEILSRNSNRFSTQMKWLDELKRPCIKCGEDRPYLIQFHHIDPSKKEFGVAGAGLGHSKEKIKLEVDKCVCMCANCHTEFHYIYGKKPKYPAECLSEYLGGDHY